MRRSAAFVVLFALLLAGCQFAGGGRGDRDAPAGGPTMTGPVTVTTLDAPTPAAPSSAPTPAAPPVTAPPSTPPVAAPSAAAPPGTEGIAPAAAPATSPAAPDAAPADPPPPPKSAAQLACEAKGGKWGRAGATSAMTCFTPTRDAGKSCRRESDCSTLCLARSRTCAPVTPLFGCHPVLQDDGREVTLCTD